MALGIACCWLVKSELWDFVLPDSFVAPITLHGSQSRLSRPRHSFPRHEAQAAGSETGWATAVAGIGLTAAFLLRCDTKKPVKALRPEHRRLQPLFAEAKEVAKDSSEASNAKVSDQQEESTEPQPPNFEGGEEAQSAEDLLADDEEEASAEEDEEGEKADEEAEDDKEEEKKKPTKWKCMDCGATNFPGSRECEKCGATKPSKEEADLMAARNEAKNEVGDVMDSFLRLQADLQNYRRQHEEAMSKAKDLGKGDALKKLLPIVEDIEAAMVEPEGLSDVDKAIFTSYSILFRKVTDSFTKAGVETCSAEVGEKFDPVRHLAVEWRQVEDDAQDPGTILEVIKTGWKCEGKVIVPAQVAVVASKEEPASEDIEDSAGEEPEEAAKEEEEVAEEATGEEAEKAAEEVKEAKEDSKAAS